MHQAPTRQHCHRPGPAPARISRQAICVCLVLTLALLVASGCSEQERIAERGLITSPAGSIQPFHLVPGSTTWVPGELMVTLVAGMNPDALNAVFGTMTLGSIPPLDKHLLGVPPGVPFEPLIALLRAHPGVLDVQPNWLVQSPEAEQRSLAFDDSTLTPEGYVDQDFLERIEASAAHAIADGSGILVAIVDTGIDQDHPQLAGNIVAGGFDFVDVDADPEDEVDGIDQDGDLLVDEAAGHGTHVAGLVLLAAPGAEILPVRVLDSEGWGDVFDVMSGIVYAILGGARVINLSLGFEGAGTEFADALSWADELGCIIVASAGNGGRDAPDHYPAGMRDVYAVTATDADDRLAEFSNYGRHIDLCAPGVGLQSTYLDGGFAIWSGTSMSTPLVSGGAALLLSIDPGADRKRIVEALGLGANDIEVLNPDYIRLIGRGRLNLRGATVAF